MTLAVFTPPNTQILGDIFYSSAPLRYGDYVAKLSVVPLSNSVTSLQDQPVPRAAGSDADRDEVVEFFRHNSAEYELRVQLCTDVKTMPIENARVQWPESASPYVGVAKITYPVQDAYSPERQVFGDDVLSFNSWRALAAHRPLGSINRLKLKVYEASSNFRHEKNHVPRLEPTDIAELPQELATTRRVPKNCGNPTANYTLISWRAVGSCLIAPRSRRPFERPWAPGKPAARSWSGPPELARRPWPAP
jgi:hypothetical protein